MFPKNDILYVVEFTALVILLLMVACVTLKPRPTPWANRDPYNPPVFEVKSLPAPPGIPEQRVTNLVRVSPNVTSLVLVQPPASNVMSLAIFVPPNGRKDVSNAWLVIQASSDLKTWTNIPGARFQQLSGYTTNVNLRSGRLRQFYRTVSDM